MPQPFPVPIGLCLNQAARAVGRAFGQALAEAGGSLPVWLILLSLKIRKPGTQRDLAGAVGITEATLTHHLNTMEADGLVTRTRDAANRRVQVVTLTEEGDQAFRHLAAAATAFDARLRTGLEDSDLATLETLLTRLSANAGIPIATGPPWDGLAGAHSPSPRLGPFPAGQNRKPPRLLVGTGPKPIPLRPAGGAGRDNSIRPPAGDVRRAAGVRSSGIWEGYQRKAGERGTAAGVRD